MHAGQRTRFGSRSRRSCFAATVFFTALVGAVVPTSALFTFGFLFLILIAIHYSVRMTALTHQVRSLTQELALLRDATAREGKLGSDEHA